MQNKAVAVIRYSLAAASAALDLLDQVESSVVETPRVVESSVVESSVVESSVVESSVVEVAPVVTEVAPVVTEVAPVVNNDTYYTTYYANIMRELNGTYHLRTVAEVTTALDLSINEIKAILEENDTEYVLRTRNRDRAPLIGLASRN